MGVWFPLPFCLKHFFVLKRVQPHITNVHSPASELLLLSEHTWIWHFQNIFKYQISWKSVQWGLSCCKWRDMTKLSHFSTILRMCPKNRSSRSRMLGGKWDWINLFWDKGQVASSCQCSCKPSQSFLTRRKTLIKILLQGVCCVWKTATTVITATINL
jgi:hypothetical protein